MKAGLMLVDMLNFHQTRLGIKTCNLPQRGCPCYATLMRLKQLVF